MARPIIHHEGFFFEWSTVVDAPISPAMTREEMVRHLQWVGRDESADKRLDRSQRQGTSIVGLGEDARRFCQFNRAGEREECLPFDQLIEKVRAARSEFGLPPL